MPNSSHSLLNYLRMVVGAWREDARTDAELLAHFAEARDETAFAALVWRHGALVWGTCRRILGDTPDAEDAFQATFLTLARKAGRFSIESLAGWLHQVARQTAMNVQSGARRRRGLEQRLRAVTPRGVEEDASRTELYAALDEEVASLPERLRVPLVLRHLEGKTLEEVARIVGCSRRDLGRRLARGEALLRQRLERRGLAVGIGSVGVFLGSMATAPTLQAKLISSTARAAVAFRFETHPAGVAEGARGTWWSLSSPPPFESSPSAALANAVMKTMLETKMIVTVLLGMTLCLAGGGLLAYQALAGSAAESAQPAGEPRGGAEASRQPAGKAARVDCFGDPLPAHALARMGTVRLWRGTGWHETAPAFSPDGKTLATHINGMTVCLWDAATGEEIRRLTTKAVKGRIVSLGFSPDSETLVTVNYDQTVCFWEVATGKFLRKQEYQGPKRDNVQSLKVAFLPDGKILGYGNFLKSVEKGMRVRGAYFWDGATGKEIRQLNRPLKEGEGAYWNTAFSRDGKMLATAVNEPTKEGGNKAAIILWDVATGKEIRQLTSKDRVNTVAFSPDGKTLASADPANICEWEVATGKSIHLFLKEEADPCELLSYSPDGKSLLGRSGSVSHLCDVATGKKIRSFSSEGAQAALFSPDGKTLAMGDGTGSIRLWEAATGKEIGLRKGYRGSIQWLAYSPDGKTLASLGSHIFGIGGDEKTVHLWEVATGKEIRQLAKGSSSFAYSPDGKMLASTGDGGVLHLWDTATDKEVRQFSGGTGRHPTSAIFSPDGKKLAARMLDNNNSPKKIGLWVWEVDTGKKICSLPTGNKDSSVNYNVELIAFSPDGRILAVADKENTVSLWEMATGTCIGQLGGPKQAEVFVRFLAFSPDGRILVTSSWNDDKVRLWEVASGKEAWQLDGYNQRKGERDGEWLGCSLAFSPDGRMLATAAQGRNLEGETEREARLWEVVSGKEIGRLTGHQAPVRTIAFAPDGKTLASGSDDLTCLIWDVTLFGGGRLQPVPARPLPAQALSKERLEAAWADLAKDSAKGYVAIGALQATPAQAIALLQARVQPVVPVANLQQLQGWIADLDADNFAVREKAQREIGKLGEPAIPALRQALKGQPSLEVKRRLQNILAAIEPKMKIVASSPGQLRQMRAVQVLESIATPEAQQVLRSLAKGAAEASLTRDAQAALTRLTKRSTAKP